MYNNLVSTYRGVNTSKDEIIQNSYDFSEKFNIPINEYLKDVPLLFDIPKLHKDPIGKCFIAGSEKCCVKSIAILFSKCLKLILGHLQQ